MARITFPPDRRPIRKVGIIGRGQVVQERIWRALQEINPPFESIVVCSIEECSGLTGLPHLYYQVDLADCILPLEVLHKRGFLGKDTLWVIATPSDSHVQYALQLRALSRVAIEKPVANTSRRARRLLPFADGYEIYSLNHKVFNASVLEFLDECRKDPFLLRHVDHIDAVFYECAGFKHGRQQEDSVEDVQWHPFMAALVAPFRVAGISFNVKVERVQVATHEPDPDRQYAPPKVWTASRVQARVLCDEGELTIDSRQAKGTPTNDKVVRYYAGNGALLKELDLSETGSQAHARMLVALMQPRPDMHVSLMDAINAMQFIDACRKRARVEPPYLWGSVPNFLS